MSVTADSFQNTRNKLPIPDSKKYVHGKIMFHKDIYIMER